MEDINPAIRLPKKKEIRIEGRGIDRPMKIARFRTPCTRCIIRPCCTKTCRNYKAKKGDYFARQRKYERRREKIRGMIVELKRGRFDRVQESLYPYGIDGFWQKMWRRKLANRKTKLPENTVFSLVYSSLPPPDYFDKFKIPIKGYKRKKIFFNKEEKR